MLMPFKAQEIRHQAACTTVRMSSAGTSHPGQPEGAAQRQRVCPGRSGLASPSPPSGAGGAGPGTGDDIICIDPESEYRPIIEGLGGEVVNISATSPNHINAMDMEQGYGDGENPVVLKSEFLLSLCEQLTAASSPPRRSPLSTAARPSATTATSGPGTRQRPHPAEFPRGAAPTAGARGPRRGPGH